MIYEYITERELKEKFKKQRKMQKDVFGKPSNESFEEFKEEYYINHKNVYFNTSHVKESERNRILGKRNMR